MGLEHGHMKSMSLDLSPGRSGTYVKAEEQFYAVKAESRLFENDFNRLFASEFSEKLSHPGLFARPNPMAAEPIFKIDQDEY